MKISLSTIDDLEKMPAPPSPPPRRAGPRNWQVAVVYSMIHTGVMTTVITVGSGLDTFGLYSLAFHGLALGLALSVGAMMRLL